MIEVYKPIKGYEGLYEVSNFGNVKSLIRKNVLREKILKPADNGKGYLLVGFSKNNKVKTFLVHQLVAMAHLNHVPCGVKLVVDHIDSNKKNNNLNNLQIITNRENISKGFKLKNGCSQYTGVSWNKDRKKWFAGIKIAGKSKHLGYYHCEIEASKAYQNKLLSLK